MKATKEGKERSQKKERNKRHDFSDMSKKQIEHFKQCRKQTSKDKQPKKKNQGKR